MTMQRYVDQLIEDIKRAKRKESKHKIKKLYDDDFEKQMEAIESTPDIQLSDQVGIQIEELPPFELLTLEQAQKIADTIVESLATYGLNVILPKEVPTELRYKLVRDLFKEEMQLIPGWTNNYNFCSGECFGCKIGDYCSTRKEVLGN